MREKPILVSLKEASTALYDIVEKVKNPVELRTAIFLLLRDLLNVERRDLEDVLTDEYKSRILLNWNDIRGYISVNKLPTHKLNSEGGFASVELIVPNTKFDVEGLDQREYLLIRCLFLVELYAKYCWYDKDQQGTQIPDEIILERLTKEIWVAINAIKIRKSYEAAGQGRDKAQLRSFVNQYIKEFQQCFKLMDVGDELIFPMGTLKHAMYLAFVKQTTDDVLLRIDDLSLEHEKFHTAIAPSKIPPYFLDLLPISALDMHADYLVKLCQIKLSNEDAEYVEKYKVPKLYNDGRSQSMLQLSIVGYPAYDRMKIGNCVVMNYSVGTRIRNHNINGTDETFSAWLLDQEKTYLAASTLFNKLLIERDDRLRGLVSVVGKSGQKFTTVVTHKTYVSACGADVKANMNTIDGVVRLLQNMPRIPQEAIEAAHKEAQANREHDDRARRQAFEQGQNFTRKARAEFTGMKIDLTSGGSSSTSMHSPSAEQFDSTSAPESKSGSRDEPREESPRPASPKGGSSSKRDSDERLQRQRTTSPRGSRKVEEPDHPARAVVPQPAGNSAGRAAEKPFWQTTAEYLPYGSLVVGAILYNSKVVPRYVSYFLIAGGALTTPTARSVARSIFSHFHHRPASRESGENYDHDDAPSTKEKKYR